MSTVTYIQLTEDELKNIVNMAAYNAVDKFNEIKSRERLLNTLQVASKLSCSRSSATNRMKSGEITGSFQEGIEWKISEYDLKKYIETLKENHNKKTNGN